MSIRASCFAILLTACSGQTRDAPPPAQPGRATILLISIDGFRWDYLDRGLTPNLSRLAREGVRAEAMVPVFPTKTFPNHYSIVTGRYPAGHGILGNVFTAPDLGAHYNLHDREAVGDGRFYLAEPIWVTAERQGQRTAPLFWPGSEAAINGVRPTYRAAFDDDIPDAERVRRVLGWLDLPESKRPTFLTLYFSGVDSVGHDFGPDARETREAIARADSIIGLLVAGLAQRSAAGEINLIVVSDHGMAATGPERVIWLDDFVSPRALEIDEISALLTAWPRAGLEDSVVRGLRRAPHFTVYRRGELPPRFHLTGSPRIPPVIAVAEEGWTMARRPAAGASPPKINPGNHGYDDSLRSMGATFLAHGPAFRRGLRVAPFRNIHLYPLMAKVLGLDPAPTDGTLDSVRTMLGD